MTCPMLQVMTDLEDKNEWKNCIDVTGVRLPTGYYFGASAGTGDLSGECVKGWLSAVNGLPSLQAFVLPSALALVCRSKQLAGLFVHLGPLGERRLWV